MAANLVDRVKKITSKLPEVDVGIDGFGHTTFKVARKSLVLIGEDSMSVKADVDTQRALVKRGPWTRTPYIGQHGWVSITGQDKIDWTEVAELIEDAYRASAPKKLLKRLEGKEHE